MRTCTTYAPGHKVDPPSINALRRVHVGVTMVSYTEKIDVLDMLINILQEHETKLDELVSRLEAVKKP